MSLEQAFYLGVALVGAVFLFISFIIGEVGEFFDDVGDFVGEQLPDFGDVGDAGDVGGGEAGESPLGSEPSPLSLRTLVAFMTAYGASGLITSSYGWNTLASSLFALVPGTGLAFVAYQMMRVFYGQQSSSVVEVARLVGQTGVVDVAIPSSGTGRITIGTDSGVATFLARGQGGAAIATGERVVVRDNLGSELIVSRAEESA